ncbi:hypothetical protein HDV02_005355 [Globomyces sp. JEL0801]|nr:hypothetical protein HDV02_005355 [Globomyces sp. JEL0801]
MIPLYVVKFNGSIEAVDVRFILIISFPPALLAAGLPFKPGNIYFIVLNSLVFVSIIAMIVCCVQTWYILKVQQLERFDQLSRRTFLATEIYKQQGSLLMMRLSVSLALVISTVFVCQVFRMVILICYNVPIPSLPKDHLPNLAWMVLFISDTIANSFGLLIALGIHNSFQQVRKFASLQQARKQVPVQQIIRQPRANPSSDTIVPSEEPNPPREVRQVNNQSSTLNELESSVRLGQIFEPLSEVSFRGRPLFDNIDTVPDNGQAHDFQPPLNLLDSSRII